MSIHSINVFELLRSSISSMLLHEAHSRSYVQREQRVVRLQTRRARVVLSLIFFAQLVRASMRRLGQQ